MHSGIGLIFLQTHIIYIIIKLIINYIFRNIIELCSKAIPVDCSDHNLIADRKTKVLKPKKKQMGFELCGWIFS